MGEKLQSQTGEYIEKKIVERKTKKKQSNLKQNEKKKVSDKFLQFR